MENEFEWHWISKCWHSFLKNWRIQYSQNESLGIRHIFKLLNLKEMPGFQFYYLVSIIEKKIKSHPKSKFFTSKNFCVLFSYNETSDVTILSWEVVCTWIKYDRKKIQSHKIQLCVALYTPQMLKVRSMDSSICLITEFVIISDLLSKNLHLSNIWGWFTCILNWAVMIKQYSILILETPDS